MSGMECFIDPQRFVPLDYPEVAELRQQGCPVKTFRQPRIDYTREFFCYTWGPSFRRICPPRTLNSCGSQGQRQIRGVGREMQSLDHFSALPIRPEGRYAGRVDPPTMAQRMGLVPMDPCHKKGTLGYSSTCATGARLKYDLQAGESICGTCVPTGQDPPKDPFLCDDFPGFDISPDLPFRVCPTQYPEPKKIRIRTGVEKCLQPSRYQDINTVYRLEFKDYIKTKTPKQISFYRTPLVIDNRRRRVTHCESTTAPDLVIGVNDGPIVLNAKAIKFQTCNKKKRPPCLPPLPDFEVFLPGPITIPC